MKHLKKFNEMREPLSYSGSDVTTMPIIGKVITKPFAGFPSDEYDIVEIIPGETEEDKTYVVNTWYKNRIPNLIHSDMVEEYIEL